jgi:general stress protein YciG
MENSKRGFAALTPERRSELARLGGLSVSQTRGRAFMVENGKKGGQQTVAKMGKEHMAAIGRKGGQRKRPGKGGG